jgi:hypothetical protein
MKKNILLSVLLILWASSAMASDLPPYGSTYSLNPFYFEQESLQNDREIVMYPNPVTEGRLTIKSEESFNSIQILNITGEIVFSQEYPMGSTLEVLELNKLEKGMYLVRIGFEGKTNHTAKIIVK